MAQHGIQGGSSSGEKQPKVEVDYLQRQLDEVPSLSESCCIYRVPKLLRGVNPEAYTPIAAPIGPLHQENYGQTSSSCDAPDLFCNGLYKLKCLKSFLAKPGVERQRCLDVVSSKIREIRAYYAHSVKIFGDNNTDNDNDSEVFAEMVLIDSAFIIELFRDKMRPPEQRDLKWMSLQSKEIARDIRLAENQLPFFILEELCDHVYHESFMEMALHFFQINHERFAFIQGSHPCHLLDMFRTSLLPYWRNAQGHISPETRRQQVALAVRESSNRGGIDIDRHEITCPTATVLYEAGIKFQVKQNAISLLDITFSNGVLSIPKLKVDDDTECLFRNLIAFEKSRTKEEVNYITDYIFFLDCLINTPTDVQLLTKASIIENWLGSEKNLSELINSMGKHAYDFSKGYSYTSLAQDLNAYYKKKWNRHRAILKQVYFSHPWAIIPVVYAVLLLLLTIIQATGSIIDIIHTVKGNKDNK